MFAIAITDETLPKILQEVDLSERDNTFMTLITNNDRYFIRGYVDPRGKLHPWIFFPGRVFRNVFVHNPTKIQTDWDQIVRR